MQEALLRLIPKTSGGMRPIGLRSALPRLWARVRRKRVREWRSNLAKECDWMRRGRGPQQAVWTQSVMGEAAHQSGLSSAAVLVDLVKAFEQVLLQLVWDAGQKNNSPMDIMRLSLEACTFPRRLVYQGAVSKRAVITYSAILAGHAFGTDFMLLSLTGPIDQLIESFPKLGVFVVADDAKFGLAGEDEDSVAQELGKATELCFHLLETQQGMQISKNKRRKEGKSIGTASSLRLCIKVRSKIHKLGVNVARGARNLGVDFRLGKCARGGGGGGGGREVYRERWRAVKRLKERVGRLGRTGAAQVTKT